MRRSSSYLIFQGQAELTRFRGPMTFHWDEHLSQDGGWRMPPFSWREPMEQKLWPHSAPFSQSPAKALHGGNPTRSQRAKEPIDIFARARRARVESDVEGQTEEISTVLKTFQALVQTVPPSFSTPHSQIPSMVDIPNFPNMPSSLSSPYFNTLTSLF